jgi:hypothetical protein
MLDQAAGNLPTALRVRCRELATTARVSSKSVRFCPAMDAAGSGLPTSLLPTTNGPPAGLRAAGYEGSGATHS